MGLRGRGSSGLAQAAAAAVCAVLATGALAGCAGSEDRVVEGNVVQPGRPGEDVTTISPGTTLPPSEDPFTEADVAFLVGMIPHHEQALEMAELAPGRAENPDVVAIASRIEDVQKAEIDVYERWLTDHGMAADGSPDDKRGDHPSHDGSADHTDMPGMASPAELEELEAATGAAFDRLWLQLMITHHEGALQMAAERETEGTNIRVGELAADVVVTQTDEIGTLQRLLGEL